MGKKLSLNQLENTGERMIPEYHKGKNLYGTHMSRYYVAKPYIKGKVVLDIASGSGYGTNLLSKDAKEVIGIDIDQESINYSKKQFGSKNTIFKKGDGKVIPLNDKSVDVVVSYETIEHISDYELFLSEIKRVLRDDGVLLLSTPNGSEYPKGNTFHVKEFTYKELLDIIGKYFVYHDDYFQTQWMSSTILPNQLQTSEWTEDIVTINTCPLQPDQCIYFLIVCSSYKINQKITPTSTIGEHYRPIDFIESYFANETQKHNYKLEIEHYKSLYSAELSEKNKLLNSKSWRVSAPLRLISGASGRLLKTFGRRK